ncbi:hypothetical protein [Bacillus smithii]|uniref:hypothetical protein n=1 Tax=Bacillus smithii TaxID=1479 RepID=UPI003D24EECF
MERKSVAVLEKINGFKNGSFLFDILLKCSHCGENIHVSDADYFDINSENTARCSACNQDTVIDYHKIKPLLDDVVADYDFCASCPIKKHIFQKMKNMEIEFTSMNEAKKMKKLFKFLGIDHFLMGSILEVRNHPEKEQSELEFLNGLIADCLQNDEYGAEW